MEMCILSGIYFWTKIVEMTVVELGCFSAKLDLMRCPQLLRKALQSCYETKWDVRLPYWDVHIARNLCLGKN